MSSTQVECNGGDPEHCDGSGASSGGYGDSYASSGGYGEGDECGCGGGGASSGGFGEGDECGCGASDANSGGYIDRDSGVYSDGDECGDRDGSGAVHTTTKTRQADSREMDNSATHTTQADANKNLILGTNPALP